MSAASSRLFLLGRPASSSKSGSPGDNDSRAHALSFAQHPNAVVTGVLPVFRVSWCLVIGSGWIGTPPISECEMAQTLYVQSYQLL